MAQQACNPRPPKDLTLEVQLSRRKQRSHSQKIVQQNKWLDQHRTDKLNPKVEDYLKKGDLKRLEDLGFFPGILNTIYEFRLKKAKNTIKEGFISLLKFVNSTVSINYLSHVEPIDIKTILCRTGGTAALDLLIDEYHNFLKAGFTARDLISIAQKEGSGRSLCTLRDNLNQLSTLKVYGFDLDKITRILNQKSGSANFIALIENLANLEKLYAQGHKPEDIFLLLIKSHGAGHKEFKKLVAGLDSTSIPGCSTLHLRFLENVELLADARNSATEILSLTSTSSESLLESKQHYSATSFAFFSTALPISATPHQSEAIQTESAKPK